MMTMGIVTVSIADVDWVDYEFSLSIVDIVDCGPIMNFLLIRFLWHFQNIFRIWGIFNSPPRLESFNPLLTFSPKIEMEGRGNFFEFCRNE